VEEYLCDPRIACVFWQDSPIPKAIVGRDGVFKATNNAWYKLLGYSRAELVGRHFREITHPADLSIDQSEVERLITDPEADGYSMVKRYLGKRGAVVYVELYVAAIRTADGTLEFFAVSIVPLPDAIQADIARAHWVGTAVSRLVGLVCQRPREFLVFIIVALVAVNRLPAELLLDFIKSLFLPQ
jgi:PAS domain S-box-containing protein